jgi:hypothetical protein
MLDDHTANPIMETSLPSIIYDSFVGECLYLSDVSYRGTR